MQKVEGDIWTYFDDSPKRGIVIPTNIGWTKAGRNVMGAGLAKDAAERWPELPEWYGKICMALREATPVCQYIHEPRVLLFPVKKLDVENPQLSWKQMADLGLIERSTTELAWLIGNRNISVLLPLVGAGNGRLDPRDVNKVITKRLGGDPRVTLVTLPGTFRI